MGSARNRTFRFSPATGLFLVLFYTLASTGGHFLLLDTILPMTKATANESFRCAGHGCCCKTAEQCAKRCCCFPASGALAASADHQPGQSEPTRVTYFAAAQCSGHRENTGATNDVRAEEPLMPTTQWTPVTTDDVRTPMDGDPVPPAPRAEPPDKVPIEA